MQLHRIAVALAALVVLAVTMTATAGIIDNQQFYKQTNLVSDGFVPAAHIDPNLINPWGLAFSPTSAFWVADNGTGLATLYNGQGVPQSLVVTIPGGAPTGNVFNPFNAAGDFKGNVFIFATENGTIASWKPADGTTATTEATGPDAIYKGLAIGSVNSANRLFATDFHGGKIDVFDKDFAPVSLGAGAFVDPYLPDGFAPFNIQNLNGKLYVTYAKQDADKEDDVAGPGNGYVSIFETDGTFDGRLITEGPLNSPWGMTFAPKTGFGKFSGQLLVGNFGNGVINVFSSEDGEFLGSLRQANGTQIVNGDLWALAFGSGANGSSTDKLYFTAGLKDEAHGLFGSIEVVPEPATIGLLSLGGMMLMARRRSHLA